MTDRTDLSLLGAPPEDSHPRIRALYDYWSAKRPAPDKLPGRQHIDPVEIPQLLRWVWLVDVLRDPLRFRYRLTGSEFIGAMGGNYTGRFVGEADPDFFSQTWGRHYSAAADQGLVGYFRGRPIIHAERNYVWMERLLLPLATDGGNVNMLLGITLYDQIQRSPI